MTAANPALITFQNLLTTGVIEIWKVTNPRAHDSAEFTGRVQASHETARNSLQVRVAIGDVYELRDNPGRVLYAVTILPQSIKVGEVSITSGEAHWSLDHGDGVVHALQLAGADANNFYLWEVDTSDPDELDQDVIEYRFPIAGDGKVFRRLRRSGAEWESIGEPEYDLAGKTVKIVQAELPLHEAGPRLQRLPNVTAALAALDLSRIDPVTGISRGETRQIFMGLADTDTDYDNVYGDYVVKRGLVFAAVDDDCTSDGAMTITNTGELAKTWAGCLEPAPRRLERGSSDPERVLVGEGSASYQRVEKDLERKQAFYSVAREVHEKYTLRPSPLVIPLAQAFIDEVSLLPTERSENEYDKFIAEWGTHYAAAVTYGGARCLMLRFDNETAESLRGVAWNAALEARAELEGLGFDHPISGTYRRSREVSAAVTSEMKSLHYLGGAVDWKKSGIGPDIQPVQVSVAPLSELLAPAVFYKHQLSVDSESLTDLNKRRALLAAAIRRNIGTYDEIERPCFVELELVKLTLPNEDKTEEIYGDVSLQLNLSDDFKESHPDTVLERTPFSRDMAPGHRVVIPAGGAMAFEAQNRMRLRFDDPQDKTLRSRKHGFMVYGRVFLYRGSVVVPLPHVELRGGFMVSFADIVKAYDPLGEAFLDGTWRARTDDAVEGVGWSTRARIHYRFRIVPLWLVAQQDWYPAQ